MGSDLGDQSRSRPRFTTQSLFYWMACIAVLAAASRNMLGLLAFASCGAVAALLQPIRRTRGLELVVRGTLASLLTALTIGSLIVDPWSNDEPFSLLANGIEVTAWHGAIAKLSPAWIALLLVATDWLLRSTRPDGDASVKPAPRLSRAILFGRFLIGAMLLVILAIHMSTVVHLTHVAMERIYNDQKPEFRRQGVYPDHATEGYFVFWIAMLVAFSAYGSLKAIAKSTEASADQRIRWVGGVLLMIAANAVYAWWFFFHEQFRSAPDFAEVGWNFNLPIVCLVVSCAVLIATWLAAKWTTETQALPLDDDATPDDAVELWRSPFIVLGVGNCLIVAANLCFFAVSTYEAYTGWMSNYLPWWSGIMIPFEDSQGLLTVAACVGGIAALRRTKTPIQWRPIQPTRRYRITWALVFLWTLVSVPALAAASFCLWLGPFWSWA